MTELVHLTARRTARRLARSGISARSRNRAGDRGVFCMPVLPSFTMTHQWVRELRRVDPGTYVAVRFRIPDDEPVLVGRYDAAPQRLTAARAAARIRELADPRGYEIFVPRAIAGAEVRHVRTIPQGVGWRYLPGAHGTRPCSCPACLAPGTPGAAKIRRRFPLGGPKPTKPELMASLRAAGSPAEIVEALLMLGGRRRGGAEELEFLAGHPDPEVREELAELLENYRGRAARNLRERLGAGEP